jgi:hypothetical protein
LWIVAVVVDVDVDVASAVVGGDDDVSDPIIYLANHGPQSQ